MNIRILSIKNENKRRKAFYNKILVEISIKKKIF
uniref:Uncharacterized protein n=1 Tax=viral metagenome TaxID=1070528 RepID=A0A6C0K6D8_9ZZZZ